MIYLNNAGTTWPKPPQVNQAIDYFSQLEPHEWQETADEAIATMCRFFNLPSTDRFIFTTGGTASLALAMSDFSWQSGDRLLISAMEHHSLSRWYHILQRERAIEGVVVPRSNDGPFDLNVLENELKKGARMVAVSVATNSTGEILPYKEIVDLSHKYGAVCLLDAAQAVGIFPIDVTDLDVDILAFPAHKGLFGPKGVGGLYLSDSVIMNCPSAACEIVPGQKKSSIFIFPTYCDTGSMNLRAMAGLTAGMQWIERTGWEYLIKKRIELMTRLFNGLSQLEEIEILGHKSIEDRTGTVGIISKKETAKRMGETLWEKYEIDVSVGFQCSPMAHESLGTEEHGIVRISVGPYNTHQDIDILLKALVEIHE